MTEPSLPAPILQARRLLSSAIARPDALPPLQHIDLQLAAGDLERVWRGLRPPVEAEPKPSQDVLRDLTRARELLLARFEPAVDVPTMILLAEVARQLQLILDDLHDTTRP